MVSAIEWDIAIGNEASQYSGWLTAFCTGGLAILISQSDKLIRPSAIPARFSTLAFVIATSFFMAGCVLGGVLKRRLKRGIELKRQQNTFFLKQKAVVLANPDLAADTSVLENLWIFATYRSWKELCTRRFQSWMPRINRNSR